MSDPLANVFGPLDGAEIPGGCEDCDAYQTVDRVGAGVWNLIVHHDDDCPTFRRMQRRRSEGGQQK